MADFPIELQNFCRNINTYCCSSFNHSNKTDSSQLGEKLAGSNAAYIDTLPYKAYFASWRKMKKKKAIFRRLLNQIYRNDEQ